MKEVFSKPWAGSQQAGWTQWSVGLAAFLFACQAAAAGPLDLDTGCNGTGKVTTGIQADPGFPMESATGVALQQDGKIVAAGSAYSGDQEGNDFALVRYKPDCGVDLTFGTNGHVLTDFGSTDEFVAGVVIQPDGRIIVAGGATNASGSDIALARYNADGTLDPSFGTGGLVRIDLGNEESVHGVALQQDGKIVVAGQRQLEAGSTSDFLIVRFLPNGALDSGFGDAGKVVTDFGEWDIAWAVAIQQDGKIVAVGSSWPVGFQPSYGALARYNANGALDTSFNRGLSPVVCAMITSCGKFRVNLGLNFYDYPIAVAVRAANGVEDGKIVVAGQFGVARFESNGKRDISFGSNGVMDSPDNSGEAVAILANGNIAVAGSDAADFGVAIYESTGESCASVATDFNGYPDAAYEAAIQADGKIVVVGFADASASGDWNFALARYKGGNCPIRLPKLGYYAAYNFFVHPQDLVGPPVDPSGPFGVRTYDQLQVGRSQNLAIPAAAGRVFAGEQPGYEAFALSDAEGARSGKGLPVAITDAFGDSVLERFEPQQLLVPIDIAGGRAGGVTVSGSRSAPLMKCYRVSTQSGDNAPASRDRKPVIVTDALKRNWTLEIGIPQSLCMAMDRRGRELAGKAAASLVGYRIRIVETTSKGPVRLPTASEFGARLFHVDKPEFLFVPAVAE